MKNFVVILLTTALLGANALAAAAEDRQSSRSAGKLKQNQEVELSAELQNTTPVVKAKPGAAENYENSAIAQRHAGVANRHDQLFEIYDGDVHLIADLDGDGYHHAINVSFDVDVNFDSAMVYAKLYLSREGEPWSQYFTTQMFQIHGDATGDAYEVETELLEGYDPGYYAVLVEIYSFDHAYMVASEVFDYHYLGKDLPIEDLYWDEDHIGAYSETSVSHGAGSMSWLLLFFLLVQVAIAARGALALIPLKKSENYNNKGSSELRSLK